MDIEQAPCFRPGQQVAWRHPLHGGYGYAELVPAIVVRTTAKRVVIAVRTRSCAPVERTVRPSSLTNADPASWTVAGEPFSEGVVNLEQVQRFLAAPEEDYQDGRCIRRLEDERRWVVEAPQ